MHKYHDKQRKIKFAKLESRITNILTDSNSQCIAVMQLNDDAHDSQRIDQSQLLKSYLQSFHRKEKDQNYKDDANQLDQNMEDQSNTIQVLYELLCGLDLDDVSVLCCDEYVVPDQQSCKDLLQKCKKNKKLMELDKIEGLDRNDDSVFSIDEDMQKQFQVDGDANDDKMADQ